MAKEPKRVKKSLGHSEVVFKCDPEGHEYLDTSVYVNGTLLCWISFPELDEFFNELSAVVSKYRI